jgi:hypothetical protein
MRYGTGYKPGFCQKSGLLQNYQNGFSLDTASGETLPNDTRKIA